jgi:hypothetical protein
MIPLYLPGLEPIRTAMRHIIPVTNDVPQLPPPFDRRKTPDRRRTWRGGRRDSDWLSRPPGVLDRFEVRQHQSRWRKALAVLHLW